MSKKSTPPPEGERLVETSQLVGAAEIAAKLDLEHAQSVHVWRRRHADFPEPVARLQQAMVWYWPDVEKWALAHDRLSADGTPIKGQPGRRRA